MLFFDGGSGPHGLANGAHGVDWIDGGGPGGLEGLKNGLDVAREFLQVPSAKSARALGQPVGGGGADGAGAPDNHLLNSVRRGAKIGDGGNGELMRKAALIDEEEGVSAAVESDGAVVGGATVEGDIHERGDGGKGRRRAGEGLGGFDLHPAKFGLNALIVGVLAEVFEIGVPGQMFEAAVAQIDGGFQGFDGRGQLVGERVAAGQIVVDDGVGWAELGQAFVDPQAFGVAPAAGVIVAQDFEGFDVGGVAAREALEEENLQVQVSQFPRRQPFSRAVGRF